MHRIYSLMTSISDRSIINSKRNQQLLYFYNIWAALVSDQFEDHGKFTITDEVKICAPLLYKILMNVKGVLRFKRIESDGAHLKQIFQ